MNPQAVKDITEGLSTLLADTYIVYLKTQNYHWNVTGPNFHSLHKMFEEQYLELANAVDEIAERIRALQAFAPASFAQYLELSNIKEETKVPSSNQMIKNLLNDHEIIIKHLAGLQPIAVDAGDEGTLDMLITRTEVHQKTAWMLRSSME